jgi:SAM-dependent methyltransferase
MARRERRALELEKRRQEKKRTRDERGVRVLELLARRRSQYADTSRAEGAALAKEGHWQWMASLLGAPSPAGAALVRGGPPTSTSSGRLLAVGCASGEGLRELLEAGWSVVSFDENIECLRPAHERCGGKLLLRGHPLELAHDAYTVRYDAVPAFGDERCVLVEGDVVDDDHLAAALAGARRFDAVTCWLVDSHEARLRHTGVRAVGIATLSEYRLGMQRLVYRLADRVLRPGGVLHVVDRAPQGATGQRLTEAGAQALLRLREKMAEGTSLELLSLDARDFLVSVRSRRGPASV